MIYQRFEEVVKKLNISPLLGRSLFALSGGQKQKIACASVAALFPEILVMDEPSSNLDIESLKKEKAVKILKALNLDEFQEVHPMSLSGGQKQRVSVACALASDKKILVYDEPTSGLDYTRMLDVAEAIKNMQKRGKTQFVITHDPELIERCCDYLMFMENGFVMEAGTIEGERLRRMKEFFMV
mgnify:CR=1 FL=1